MKNIFALTKREQRVIILIMTLLVAASFAKHHVNIRADLRPVRSTSTLSATVTPSPRAENAPTPNDIEAR
jgi:hypothetical protein